jgi:DNA polymerase-3 subunit delta'
LNLDFCVGHDHIQRYLEQSVLTGKLPHAILFYGDSGIGKSKVAHRLARYILAHESASPSLMPLEPLYVAQDSYHGNLVVNRAHPDLNVIELGEVRTISVDKVRAAVQLLRVKPALGRWRVIIVDDVHAMTRQAANSLLKILEDPPSHAIFILVAHGNVLPTIRSRCCIVPFQPLVTEGLQRVLKHLQQGELSHDQIEAAQGQVSLALQLVSDIGQQVWQALENTQKGGASSGVAFAQQFADSIPSVGEVCLAWIAAQARRVLGHVQEARHWAEVWGQVRVLFMQYHQSNLDATATLYQAYNLCKNPRQ